MKILGESITDWLPETEQEREFLRKLWYEINEFKKSKIDPDQITLWGTGDKVRQESTKSNESEKL